MMITQQALLAGLALVTTTSAFTTPSASIAYARTSQLHSTTDGEVEDRYKAISKNDLQSPESHDQEDELLNKLFMDVLTSDSTHDSTNDAAETQPSQKLIMDIPPTPSAAPSSEPKKPAYTVVNTKKAKPFAPKHQEGLLSPLVYAAYPILGKDELNKLRAKIISYHSDIIKSFVDTSDSNFGKAVLKQLFEITDVDRSGYLDKEEVTKALGLLGFTWLEEKQVNKIFERADLNDDGEISMEEFMEEAPKTLKVNLVKLAKKNGGELGLLV